jgi:hypothetical protein
MSYQRKCIFAMHKRNFLCLYDKCVDKVCVSGDVIAAAAPLAFYCVDLYVGRFST